MATSVPCKKHLTAYFERNINVNPTGECNADSLYPDVLAIIFNYLDLADIGRARQVCRTWHDVINHLSVFRQATAQINSDDIEEQLPFMVKRDIRSVKLRRPNRVNIGNALLILAEGMPRLSGLEIEWYTIDNKIMSDVLLEKMPQLTHLKLASITNCVDRISQKLTNLVTLKLGRSLLTDTEVRIIASRLGALKHFEVEGCRELTDEGIRYLAGLNQQLVHKPNLETLSLAGCTGLTNQSLLYLSQGQMNLKELNLSHMKKIFAAGLAHLVRLPYLEKLKMNGCSIGSPGIIHIAQMVNLRTFHAYPIGDEGLAFLANSGSKIETFDIPTSVTSVGAFHLSRLTHLRYLQISVPDYASSERDHGCGLVYLARMTSLRKLSIWVGKTTDNDLAHLAFSNITVLELISCFYISDHGLGHLSKLISLEAMVIKNCSGITDVGLIKLASGRAKITQLDVRGFYFKSPSGPRSLELIAKGLFPLRVLGIDRIFLDDDWFSLVAKNLPNLHTLNSSLKNTIRSSNIIGEVRKFREDFVREISEI